MTEITREPYTPAPEDWREIFDMLCGHCAKAGRNQRPLPDKFRDKYSEKYPCRQPPCTQMVRGKLICPQRRQTAWFVVSLQNEGNQQLRG